MLFRGEHAQAADFDLFLITRMKDYIQDLYLLQYGIFFIRYHKINIKQNNKQLEPFSLWLHFLLFSITKYLHYTFARSNNSARSAENFPQENCSTKSLYLKISYLVNYDNSLHLNMLFVSKLPQYFLAMALEAFAVQ